jgi:hypothetical protein
MFWQRYGKIFVIPAVAVLGITVGAVGGAVAFDQFAARYLWPEPENLVVQHASPSRDTAGQVAADEVPSLFADDDPIEPLDWDEPGESQITTVDQAAGGLAVEGAR